MENYIEPYELYHYGVKGMKWGVRRYQNKDGSLTPLGLKRVQKGEKRMEKASSSGKDFTIRKDQTVYRWSTKNNETFDSRYKYASLTKKDMRKYSSLYDDNVTTYLYEMQPIKKLKVAGYAETTREVLKQCGDKSYKEITKNMSSEEIRNKLYGKYGENGSATKQMWRMLDLHESGANGLTAEGNKVVEALSKKGYDAVVDIWDKTSGFSDLPVVLLNPEKSVKSREINDLWEVIDKYDL